MLWKGDLAMPIVSFGNDIENVVESGEQAELKWLMGLLQPNLAEFDTRQLGTM
jgi:hypothetical protein